MKITLTKRQVIQALQTEPLMSGSYIHNDDVDDNGNVLNQHFKSKTGCAVCAVGSLLDFSIGTKNNSEELCSIGSSITSSAVFGDSEVYTDDDTGKSLYEYSVREVIALARKEAANGRYLSALSSLFEELSNRDGMTTNNGLAGYRLVNILVNFVKAEFPAKLVINTKKRY